MVSNNYIVIEQSPALQGTIDLYGAKNAVLVIIASLLLTRGKSRLSNVPASDDVFAMIKLIESLGGQAFFMSKNMCLRSTRVPCTSGK